MSYQMYLYWLWLGTKWCGPGTIASNDYDLGRSQDTDMCCREHDHCFDFIPPGQWKHGLYNPDDGYTAMHCDCDEKFRRCLHRVNGWAAAQIGRVYFNFKDIRCFREDYPVIGCGYSEDGWWQTKCKWPAYDYDGQKCYQWFKPNFY